MLIHPRRVEEARLNEYNQEMAGLRDCFRRGVMLHDVSEDSISIFGFVGILCCPLCVHLPLGGQIGGHFFSLELPSSMVSRVKIKYMV